MSQSRRGRVRTQLSSNGRFGLADAYSTVRMVIDITKEALDVLLPLKAVVESELGFLNVNMYSKR